MWSLNLILRFCSAYTVDVCFVVFLQLLSISPIQLQGFYLFRVAILLMYIAISNCLFSQRVSSFLECLQCSPCRHHQGLCCCLSGIGTQSLRTVLCFWLGHHLKSSGLCFLGASSFSCHLSFLRWMPGGVATATIVGVVKATIFCIITVDVVRTGIYTGI